MRIKDQVSSSYIRKPGLDKKINAFAAKSKNTQGTQYEAYLKTYNGSFRTLALKTFAALTFSFGLAYILSSKVRLWNEVLENGGEIIGVKVSQVAKNQNLYPQPSTSNLTPPASLADDEDQDSLVTIDNLIEIIDELNDKAMISHDFDIKNINQRLQMLNQEEELLLNQMIKQVEKACGQFDFEGLMKNSKPDSINIQDYEDLRFCFEKDCIFISVAAYKPKTTAAGISGSWKIGREESKAKSITGLDGKQISFVIGAYMHHYFYSDKNARLVDGREQQNPFIHSMGIKFNSQQ